MADEVFDVPELETLNLLNAGTEVDWADAAISYIQSVMPEWTPRGGSTEVVLIEALAVMLGPEILSLQLLGPRVVEQLVGLMGTTRSQGAEARGRVEFTVTNSAPVQVIPAGTRLRLNLDRSLETVDLFTTEDLSIITSESLTGQVNVIAEQVGSLPNGSPSGAPLSVVDNLPFIEAAALSAALLGGADVEADSLFNARAAAALARQNSTLVHSEQFAYAALSQVGIGRALTLDNFNPAAPGVTSYGHVTVAVAGLDGLAVDSAVMTDIRNTLAEQALASLNIHVIAPTYTPVDIAVTVRAAAGWSEAEVQASVQAALAKWVDPLTWGWDDSATQFEIVAVVSAAPGVREVISAPTDISLSGDAPLPTPGLFTVTVV
jgi:hypothetical protein